MTILARRNKIFSLLALLLSAFLFQNCSRVHFKDLSSSGLDLRLENNGGGYGGKPDYYRFTPGFTCAQKSSAAKASIEILGANFTFIDNKKLACSAQVQTLDSSLLDRSIYQREIIGYREGIFEGEDSTPLSVPANLVEVWCKDSNDDSGIETITHYNRDTQQAVTKIYYSVSGQPQKIADFPVSRIFSSQQITIQNPTHDDQFHLEVYRNQPAPTFGLFKGLLRGVIDGKPVSRQTFCRLGGSFDPSIWPVAQVVDSWIENFKFSPDLNSYAFTSRTASSTNSWNLFAGDIAGANFKQVSPNMLQSGVTRFEFTNNSRSISYWGDPQVASVMSLLKVPVDPISLAAPTGPSSTELSPQITGIKFEDNLQLSGDGTRVVYANRDAANPLAHDILSILLTGGTPTPINLPLSNLPLSVTGLNWDNCYEFATSKTAGRMAYLAGPENQVGFFLIDTDGTHRIQPNIQFPSPGWSISHDTASGNFLILDSIQSVLVSTFDSNRSNFQQQLISFDGLNIQALPLNWEFWALAGDGHHLLLSSRWNFVGGPANSPSLYDLQNASFTSIPNLDSLQFNRASTALLGLTTAANQKKDLVSLSLQTNQMVSLCPQADGDSVKFFETESGDLYLTSSDSINHSVHVFLKTASAACRDLKSFPISGQPFVYQSTLSADGAKMLVQMRTIQNYKAQDRLIYVPLNPLDPAIEINSPVHSEASVDQVSFLKDSSSVFYIGDQINKSESNAFLWHAPKK